MKKEMLKFGILSLVLVVALSLALVGCSTGSNSGNSGERGSSNAGNTQPESNGDITTITFWHPMTDITGDAMEAVIAAFEEKNSNIKINAVYSPGGEGSNERLLTAIAGGNPPDVSYFDRFEIGSWAGQDALTDITELAAADGVSEALYYPFAWQEASYNGGLYGLPTTTDSRLVFYNKDHFEEAGLDPNNPPATIAELDHATDLLTIKSGNRFERIGFIPWYGQGWLYGWGWSFGGDFYDKETGLVTANDPKIVEALEWMVEFGTKYGVEDIAGFQDSQGSGAMDPFISGQLSMQVSGPWTVSAIERYNPDLNYGVFPMPNPTGTDYTTWSGGWSVVMPKGAKNVEAAWEFMKFFAGEEGQMIFSEISRDFSVIDSANVALGYTDDPILTEFVNILPVSNHRPVITEGSLLWNELASAVENATRGNGTPQEILDAVTEKVNTALGN